VSAAPQIQPPAESTTTQQPHKQPAATVLSVHATHTAADAPVTGGSLQTVTTSILTTVLPSTYWSDQPEQNETVQAFVAPQILPQDVSAASASTATSDISGQTLTVTAAQPDQQTATVLSVHAAHTESSVNPGAPLPSPQAVNSALLNEIITFRRRRSRIDTSTESYSQTTIELERILLSQRSFLEFNVETDVESVETSSQQYEINTVFIFAAGHFARKSGSSPSRAGFGMISAHCETPIDMQTFVNQRDMAALLTSNELLLDPITFARGSVLATSSQNNFQMGVFNTSMCSTNTADLAALIYGLKHALTSAAVSVAINQRPTTLESTSSSGRICIALTSDYAYRMIVMQNDSHSNCDMIRQGIDLYKQLCNAIGKNNIMFLMVDCASEGCLLPD